MRYVRNGWYGKCGVYLITCTVNGKQYVGASVNICSRVNQHFNATCLRKYSKVNDFYKDIAEYGRDAFTVEVLEFCGKEKKIETERKWFYKLKPEYNQVVPDECPLTHEEVQKKSLAGSKTVNALRNRLASHQSQEYREKMRLLKRNTMQPCRAHSSDGTVYEFESKTAAARWANPTAALASVISHINTAMLRNGTAYGFRWEVITK